ncbi:hypothetical protein MHB50_06690 [Siminovitchia sp. FSL H7-0308]|jgi:hypothetical protein|uniref:Uncharacterized protein n=1 Tax=Siminovitchia thermophila TaxID=1245522 RepID=A0ABS2RBI9_9BACI|nr:hypothetical protein [Siminovitchia thermophila]MBM7716514.1 hypothetical protein [Siminovitchia thermophila]
MRTNEKSHLASVNIPHYIGLDFQNLLENDRVFETKQEQEMGLSHSERNALKRKLAKG